MCTNQVCPRCALGSALEGETKYAQKYFCQSHCIAFIECRDTSSIRCTHTCTYTHAHLHICISTHMYKHTIVNTCMQRWSCDYDVCTRTHTHTHAHTHTHTHKIHIHKHTIRIHTYTQHTHNHTFAAGPCNGSFKGR